MDWSPPDAGWQGRWQRRPSFLYAMALDDDHIFCEETEKGMIELFNDQVPTLLALLVQTYEN